MSKVGGTSSNLLDKECFDDITNLVRPTTCLDIGVGMGKFGKFIKKNDKKCKVIGFELCECKVDFSKKHLEDKYDLIINEDFWQWIHKSIYRQKIVNSKNIKALEKELNWSSDLVVFGDVLEHMLKSRVFDVLDFCEYRTKWMTLVIPLNLRQGSHASSITLDDLKKYNIVHYVKKDFLTYYLIRGMVPLKEKTHLNIK